MESMMRAGFQDSSFACETEDLSMDIMAMLVLMLVLVLLVVVMIVRIAL
jgi:hypothetical protein